jgi:integrase
MVDKEVKVKTLEVLDKVLKGKRIKPSTKRHYMEILGALAKYSEEWPKSGVVINEWLVSLDKYADTTVKMWFNYVNAAGKYIKKTCRIKNPCETADRPKVSKKRRRYFNSEEIMRIIEACKYEQDRALVLTLIDSTARIGELAGITQKNVGDSWIDVKGKTGERRYRLDPKLCQLLKTIGSDGRPIFKGRHERPADVNSLKHRVRRIIRRAGITCSKLGPHTLRHSGASLVARETGSALVVKALLQHDKIDTSMEYIHDVEDVIQQSISPLRLVSNEIFGDVNLGAEIKQITMGSEITDNNTTDLVPVEVEVVEGVIDLTEEMFPEIDEGIKVRPLFKTEDLRMIRRVFVSYARSNAGNGEIYDCQDLMKRMLRKSKGRR